MVIWDFRSQLENLVPVVKVVIGGKEVFHTVRLSAQLLELCACVLHIMQSASQLYSCSCGHQIVKNSCLTACLALSCFSKPTRQIWPARWESSYTQVNSVIQFLCLNETCTEGTATPSVQNTVFTNSSLLQKYTVFSRKAIFFFYPRYNDLSQSIMLVHPFQAGNAVTPSFQSCSEE